MRGFSRVEAALGANMPLLCVIFPQWIYHEHSLCSAFFLMQEGSRH